MKAKISYTVEIDDIPQEVNKMMVLPQTLLSKAADESFSLDLRKDTVYQTINQIEEIRKKMLIADTRLAECQSVLVGYNKELARQKAEVSTEQSSQETEETNDVSI